MALLLTVRDVIALLKREGWVLVRVRGSHRQFHHPIQPGTVTVAGGLGNELARGTLRSIFKQAGLR